MAIKPPFNFLVMIVGKMCSHYETNSLSKAKQVGEELFMKEGLKSTILSVYFETNECRPGWLCKRILKIEDDCSWSKDFSDFVIHCAFLWNYNVREWNPKLYDRIRTGYVSGKLRYEDSWEYTKQYLELDKEKDKEFKKEVKRACEKVEKKINEFILANDTLTALVKKKYPNVHAEYAIFDRMILFHFVDEMGNDKIFYSFEEVEKYFSEH